MPSKEERNAKMKLEALEKAREYVEAMRLAKTNPTVSIDGEALKIWKELEEWGWLNRFPIENEDNSWLYEHMLAMTQYRHKKWQAAHPVPKDKPKKSKWEVVMGSKGVRK